MLKTIALVKENENSCKLECGANTGMNTETDIKKQTEEPKAQTMPFNQHHILVSETDFFLI